MMILSLTVSSSQKQNGLTSVGTAWTSWPAPLNETGKFLQHCVFSSVLTVFFETPWGDQLNCHHLKLWPFCLLGAGIARRCTGKGVSSVEVLSFFVSENLCNSYVMRCRQAGMVWNGLLWMVVSLNHDRLAVDVVVELVAGEDHCQKLFSNLRVSRLHLGQCARRVCHGILLLEAGSP